MSNVESIKSLMQWYLDAGVDETIQNQPFDRFQAFRQQQAESPAPVPDLKKTGSRTQIKKPLAKSLNGGEVENGIHNAIALAKSAATVKALANALQDFDDCALKKTATNPVFMDGPSDARVLLIGDAPGADEDRRGKPFVGPGGQLLDKMLKSIGLDRKGVATTNTVFWRPPGKRTLKPQEMAMCMPFVERLIELVEPDVLVILGGTAANCLLGKSEGIGKLHGRWTNYSTPGLSHPVDVMVIHHPDYLIKTPRHKRNAWADLLKLKQRLDEKDPRSQAG